MGFFSNLFKHVRTDTSVVLIDISAHSISGAYAYYEKGAPPRIVYGRHLPIPTAREHETLEAPMLRTLKALGELLIREGAPALVRATGHGNANVILVSIDAPWQETHIRTERFDAQKPFVFTKELLEKRLAETRPERRDGVVADESVIGSILNGYETRKPYGRLVHTASVILFSSIIKEDAVHAIFDTLSGLFHTKNILPISGNSLRYQAARALLPHEHEAIVIDAIDRSGISIALIKNNLFATMRQLDIPADDSSWAKNVPDELTKIAQEYPLPRLILLLAKEVDTATLQDTLMHANLHALWLSDTPPKIIAVINKHLSAHVRYDSTAESDVSLMLMALYFEYRHSFPAEILTAQ